MRDGDLLGEWASSGTAVTLDQNGNVTGQMASLPTQSWLGNSYQLGSTEEVLSPTIPLASVFAVWPFGGNSTATKLPPFAQLVSCNDKPGGTSLSCPQPKDAAFNAWWYLKERMADSELRKYDLENYVFLNQKDGHSLYDRGKFIAYLNLGAEFYDGPRSTVTLGAAVCGGITSRPVQDEFAANNNSVGCFLAAITCRLDRSLPERTFFEPNAISLDNQGATDGNIALEFHEAMHGFTGLADPELQDFLGCTKGYDDHRDITLYLQQFVSTEPPQGKPKTCKQIESDYMPGNKNVCVRPK